MPSPVHNYQLLISCEWRIWQITSKNENTNISFIDFQSLRFEKIYVCLLETMRFLVKLFLLRKEEFVHQRKKRNTIKHALEDMATKGSKTSTASLFEQLVLLVRLIYLQLVENRTQLKLQKTTVWKTFWAHEGKSPNSARQAAILTFYT